MQSGNGDATTALIEQNLPLIGYHVSEMLSRVPAHVSRDDLASAGALALVTAAKAYDPSTGVPFNRYAALRIRGALVDELRSMDWASRGVRRRAREMATVTDRLTAELGREPSREELAAAMGTAVADVDAVRNDAERRTLSMDGFDNAIADTVAEPSLGPEERLLASERIQYLHAAIATLPDRLRHVVEQIFLADRPVAELAAELGVTQSRISQLRAEALTLLRDGMNASLDPDLVRVPERPAGVAERRRQAYFAAVAERAADGARAFAASALSATVPHQRPAPDHEVAALQYAADVAG